MPDAPGAPSAPPGQPLPERPARVEVTMTVNGRAYTRVVEPRLLLVDFLRNELGLTGTHVGCDTTNCGACTVHLDGRSVKSCTLFAVQADGRAVRTVEGLSDLTPPAHLTPPAPLPYQGRGEPARAATGAPPSLAGREPGGMGPAFSPPSLVGRGAGGVGLHPLQQAFHEAHALQCGYCTPGMLMSALYLLERQPRPSRDEIKRAIAGNLCRCTGYEFIIEAIELAAARLAGEAP